jgi:hypothetical protein
MSYREGVTATHKKYLTEEISELNKSIGNLQAATRDAGHANLLLNQTISKRQKADAESTKVFANALAATAHLRFNCLFDHNIMQQISETADRADQAATSGISFTLPTSSPPDG